MRNDPSRNPGAEHRTEQEAPAGWTEAGLPAFRTPSGETFDPDRVRVVDAHILQKLRDAQRENRVSAGLGSEILRLAGLAAAVHRGMVAGIGHGITVAEPSDDRADSDDRPTLSEDAA